LRLQVAAEQRALVFDASQCLVDIIASDLFAIDNGSNGDVVVDDARSTTLLVDPENAGAFVAPTADTVGLFTVRRGSLVVA